MKIATIVPTAHLNLIAFERYHMALAHVARKSERYAKWFFDQSCTGAFILLDNGAAELGSGVDVDLLVDTASRVRAAEVIVPDKLSNGRETLKMGELALANPAFLDGPWTLMCVPQGQTELEYLQCAREMSNWPIDSIGISRFLVDRGMVQSRIEVIPKLLDIFGTNVDYHLLGCPDDPLEAFQINQAYPGIIRGTDSGIASLFTQINKRMDGPGYEKPRIELRFDSELDADLLKLNVILWRNRLQNGGWL